MNPLSANPTKWSNTLKKFVGNLLTDCFSVFDHFVKLAHKGLKMHFPLYVYKEIRSDIEICSKKLAIPLFNFGKQHITTNACKKLQLQLYIVVIVV